MSKKISKYTIELIENEDGTIKMSRINDGFNVLELIGVLEFTKDELIKQIKGEIKPDVVTRTVIDDSSTKKNEKQG